MITIRNAQMVVFERAIADRFAARLVPHLLKTWPKECAGLSEAQVKERAADAVMRGKPFGFVAEQEAGRFVDLTFVLGAGFEDEPWAAEILHEEELTSGERMEKLWASAKQELRHRRRKSAAASSD